mmetsp:Transcript_31742/g.69359  ORF Transcript_31742/g.69359 Transcript_31742/m.69359 type:complete len:150 (-) Transcript_31742:544-993(-)
MSRCACRESRESLAEHALEQYLAALGTFRQYRVRPCQPFPQRAAHGLRAATRGCAQRGLTATARSCAPCAGRQGCSHGSGRRGSGSIICGAGCLGSGLGSFSSGWRASPSFKPSTLLEQQGEFTLRLPEASDDAVIGRILSRHPSDMVS